MSKSWEAKSSRWSQRLQRAEEWPGLLKARCKYPVVISIKRGILCKVCVYIPKYSALSPCCFTVFRLLIHQCPPGGLPETPRASAAPVSTWILLGKHPAWEGILSLLLIKPGGSWQEMPPGFPFPPSWISKAGKSGWCPELPPGSQRFGVLFCYEK